MKQQANPSGNSQYLGFTVAGEEYGVGILRVKEILQFDTLTRVPNAPRSIRGVINLRGSVVPVVDLAVKLGLPESAITPRSCVVVLEVALDGEAGVMGFIADAVNQVIDLASEDIEPPPAFGPRIHAEFLLGMGRSQKKFILLLDIDRLLTEEDLRAARPEAPAAEAGAPA